MGSEKGKNDVNEKVSNTDAKKKRSLMQNQQSCTELSLGGAQRGIREIVP